jgi:hypothetical protein
MNFYVALFSICLFSTCSADNNWLHHWHQAHDHCYNSRYQDASLEFDQAISMMTDEDLET